MTFDVAIAGGGPAGMAAALELARGGLAVAVIDPRTRRPRHGETLAPGCRPLLARLGVLEPFLAGPHGRCDGTMAAWGTSEVHVTDYVLHPERNGWRLDRDSFDGMLAAEAARRGVVLVEANIDGVGRNGVWSVATDRGELAARLLVDATGRHAAIARRLGAARLAADHLVGIAGVFEPHAPIERAYPLIEARQEGWIYSAILPDGRLAVVVMTDSDLAHELRLHDETSWRQWIAEAPHSGRRIAGAALLSGPAAAAAGSQRLDAAAGEAWLAVGDAAAAYDPLSSQGIVNALRSGIDAAAAIRASRLDDYARTVRTEYDGYLETRSRYYAMETRWPQAPFWRRRARGSV